MSDASPASRSSTASTPILPVGRDTRTALWEHAGVERSAEGLERLLDDLHPLARLIARSALERKESRGTHVRSDHPDLDRALDGRHAVVDAGKSLDWQAWE
jgi:L-aspartate oxidase